MHIFMDIMQDIKQLLLAKHGVFVIYIVITMDAVDSHYNAQCNIINEGNSSLSPNTNIELVCFLII